MNYGEALTREEAREASVTGAEARRDESLFQLGRSEAVLDRAVSEAEQAVVGVETAQSAWELAEERLAGLIQATDQAVIASDRARLALEQALGATGEGRARLAQAEELRMAANQRRDGAEVSRENAEAAFERARVETLKAQQLYDKACRDRSGIAPDAVEWMARQRSNV